MYYTIVYEIMRLSNGHWILREIRCRRHSILFQRAYEYSTKEKLLFLTQLTRFVIHCNFFVFVFVLFNFSPSNSSMFLFNFFFFLFFFFWSLKFTFRLAIISRSMKNDSYPERKKNKQTN